MNTMMIIEVNTGYFDFQAATKLNNLIYISDNTGSCAKGQDPKAKQANGSEALVMFANGMLLSQKMIAENIKKSVSVKMI